MYHTKEWAAGEVILLLCCFCKHLDIFTMYKKCFYKFCFFFIFAYILILKVLRTKTQITFYFWEREIEIKSGFLFTSSDNSFCRYISTRSELSFLNDSKITRHTFVFSLFIPTTSQSQVCFSKNSPFQIKKIIMHK